MKAIKILLVAALLASVASNVYLWLQLSRQRAETFARQDGPHGAQMIPFRRLPVRRTLDFS